jgi:hypothetical protein
VERRRRRRGARGQGLRHHPEPSKEDAAATGAPPRLRPHDYINVAALPAQLRPAGLASPQPRAFPSSAPSVSTAIAVPVSFPCAAGVADEPPVATLGTLPFRPPCHFSCRSPSRRFKPRKRRRPRRRVVLRARDAGASRTARPRRGPGLPGPARVRARPCRGTRPCPPSARHAQPRHGLAVRVRPRDAAATSRSRRGQAVATFSRAPFGCPHQHTPSAPHVHTHTLSPHWI